MCSSDPARVRAGVRAARRAGRAAAGVGGAGDAAGAAVRRAELRGGRAEAAVPAGRARAAVRARVAELGARAAGGPAAGAAAGHGDAGRRVALGVRGAAAGPRVGGGLLRVHRAAGVVAACGLPNHRLGVRCLWLAERPSASSSTTTTRAPVRAVAISPPAPNTLECWQVAEECSVELAHRAQHDAAAPARALPAAAEDVLLRALDVLGVVGAPSRFALLRLEGASDAIRAATQLHFEPLGGSSGKEDRLVYWKTVAQRTKTVSMPVASWEALQEQLKLLNSLPEIDQKLTELHVTQFAGLDGRSIRPVRGDL